MQVKDIMQALEKLAPQQLKEDWDNVGLQLGDPNAEVRRVLLALTPSLAVTEEAVRRQADLIVSHHPFIFKGVKSLRTDSAIGRMSQLCLKHDIAIYSAHTNLDIARGGVNDVLAERLGLVDVEGLAETARKPRYKLVVFVPLSHLEQVKAALFAAGAGAQGAYEACAWTVQGTGQFRPQAGASPYLGTPGQLEQVKEARLEVLVDHDRLAAVLQALGISVLAVAGPTQGRVERVALCGGSATEFLAQAKAAGADVYVTGDMKYHDAQQAVEMGLPMVDVSHYAGERPVLAKLAAYLQECFGTALDVVISEDEENFLQYR